MSTGLLLHLAVAAGLGLLVGLQRERSPHSEQGIRTFTLITVFGVLCGWMASMIGEWIAVAGLLSAAALTVTANVLRARAAEEVHAGMTTEVAVLVMYGVGVALSAGALLPGIVVGGATALLLHWKEPMHAFAERLGSADFAAIMRLTLLSLVILPILPNRPYGPYDVLNPFQIWLMVVLIVGISLGGYVAYRLFGEKRGALTAGILGGLISSTATTVSYARRSAGSPERSPAAALVVTVASTVVFARVLVELMVVSRTALAASWGPLAAMMAVMIVISGVLLWAGADGTEAELADQEPPSNMGSALTFGLLYAAVLLGVAWAHDRFDQGVYIMAVVSGLTDVDAITLSTAQLMESGEMPAARGWRVILIGALANTLFKGGIVAVLGHRVMTVRVALAFTAALMGGAAVFLLWPG